MKDYLQAALGIFIAFIFYTVLFKISVSLVLMLNAFSVIVIYFAFRKGEVFGAVMGMICGLIQDSFSLGVFGVAGIAKTILGYLAGSLSKKMNVFPFGRTLIINIVLLTIELTIWSLFFRFIFSENINTGGGIIFLQPLGTAVAASALFPLLRKIQVYITKRNEK
jgi:rod shape-determining protein MreD